MNRPARYWFGGAILLLAVALIVSNLRQITEWGAETAVRHTLTRQTSRLASGGSVSVSSDRLDSLWREDLRYLLIFPLNIPDTERARWAEIDFPTTVLGICADEDTAAIRFFRQHDMSFLTESGFGLTSLQPKETPGLYTIRRKNNQSGGPSVYVLTGCDEF